MPPWREGVARCTHMFLQNVEKILSPRRMAMFWDTWPATWHGEERSLRIALHTM